MSRVCPDSWPSCIAKILALDITHKSFQPNLFIPAILIGTVMKGWDLQPSGWQPLGSSISKQLSSERGGWEGGVVGEAGGGGGGGGGGG